MVGDHVVQLPGDPHPFFSHSTRRVVVAFPLGLLGLHNRRNALIARACLAALGVPQAAEQVYGSDGREIAGASIAVSDGRRLLIGSSLDNKLLDCTQ